MHYCYLFETFDEPAEHINPAGDVIGSLICALKEDVDGIVSCSVGGVFKGELDEYHGDCCQGYDVSDEFVRDGVDGIVSEDGARTVYHDLDPEDVIVPDIVDEWWYTLVDIECDY